MKTETYMIIVVAVSIIISLIAFMTLPETVAVHWNMDGQADGFAPTFWGVVLFPIIILATSFVYVILPKIDPLKQDIETFREPFAQLMLVIQLFFLYIFFLFLATNSGYVFNFVQWMAPGFTFLLFFMGAFLPQFKRNYFIGFRTPWTLASDDVWNETHKQTGRMFRIFAFLPLAGFFSEKGMIFWILFAVIVPTAHGLIFSYIYFKRMQGKKGPVRKKGRGK